MNARREDKTLQKAIDALQIRDVYLRTSQTLLADDFEPKYDNEFDRLEVQLQHAVTQTSVLKLEEEGAATVELFRVFVQLGARWLEPESDASTQPGDSRGEDSRLQALVAGVMVAEYEMQTDPGSDALKAFALRNASYHVWPYWREFLAAQCMRMNLPKLVLPTVQFAKESPPK